MHNFGYRSSPTNAVDTSRKIPRESVVAEVGIDWSSVYVYIIEGNPDSNMLLTSSSHGHLAIHVITQQYSSAILVSLNFHSSEEKFGARLKNVIQFFNSF